MYSYHAVDGAWGAVSSCRSLVDVELVASFLTLISMEDDLQDLFDQMEDNTLPIREVLDRGEAVSKKLQAALTSSSGLRRS